MSIDDIADDLEVRIHEDALMQHEDPAAIATEVSKLLDGLGPEHIFVVHRIAKHIAATIRKEHGYRQSDMVSVIQRLGAALQPLNDWLKTTTDSSLAERFKPRCAVGQPTSRKTSPAQPAGTHARLLPTDKRPPTRRGGRG